jgi:hypothetical protein
MASLRESYNSEWKAAQHVGGKKKESRLRLSPNAWSSPDKRAYRTSEIGAIPMSGYPTNGHNHNVCGIKTLPFIDASQPSLICFCFEILRPTSVVWCHVHFLELSLSFRSVGHTYSVVPWDFLHRIASRPSHSGWNRSLPALIQLEKNSL